MKYRHSYVVQYQDIDDTRRLRLHTMENRLLIVAGKVADEIGIGIPYLMQHPWRGTDFRNMDRAKCTYVVRS